MNFEKFKRQLIGSEGFREAPYLDSEGYWTIGYGNLIDDRKGAGVSNTVAAWLLSRNWAWLKNGLMHVTRDGADYLLDRYVARMLTELVHALPWWEKLDDVRQRVVAEMAYQMGLPTLLTFETTLGHMERGEVEQAADAMLKSKWARQTPTRARRLSNTYRTGKDEA